MQRWPIFVLTLPGDEERRAPLLRRLDGFGLDYELFMGVDGRAGLPDDYRGMVDPDAARDRLGYSMTDGEFACALSHRAIYARLCDDNLPGAIILEDDAQLADGFADFIRSDCYQKLPMTLIDYAFGRALPLLRHRPTGGQPWVLRRAVQGTVTTAYTLRQDAARRLLDATTPSAIRRIGRSICSRSAPGCACRALHGTTRRVKECRIWTKSDSRTRFRNDNSAASGALSGHGYRCGSDERRGKDD